VKYPEFMISLEWKHWIEKLHFITRALPPLVLCAVPRFVKMTFDIYKLRSKVIFLDEVLGIMDAPENQANGSDRDFNLGVEINRLM
jgi:hypothetical protein